MDSKQDLELRREQLQAELDKLFPEYKALQAKVAGLGNRIDSITRQLIYMDIPVCTLSLNEIRNGDCDEAYFGIDGNCETVSCGHPYCKHYKITTYEA